jgi:integrase
MSRKRAHGEGTIFQEKTGLWVAEISLPNGNRKRKRSKFQKVVKEWLLKEREAVRDGLVIEETKITISEFMDRYYNDVAVHTLRPKTLESYESLIRVHIKPYLGDLRLHLLRPDHLQKLYSDKLNAGLSKRSVHYIHSILHKALEHALRWGLVVRNVADLADPPPIKRPAPNIWTINQINQFLNAAKEHRFYPIYVLAIATGMREGELLGLQIEDVDWTSSTIHVKHALQYLKGHWLSVTEPKTEKARRTIKVPEFAFEVLKKHVEQQEKRQGFVFTTGNGTPIYARNMYRHFKNVIEENALPEIRFHDLRHTCASLHLLAGTHPKTVQELLGHSQISLTLDTYSSVMPGIQEEAAERLNTLFKGSFMVESPPSSNP